MAAEPAPSSLSSGVKRIAFVATSSGALLDLHGPLIANLVGQRHKVHCFAPDVTAGDQIAFSRFGASADAVPVQITSLNPFADFLLRRQWSGTLKALAPHALVTLDLPTSALLGSIAARLGVPRVVATAPKVPVGLGDAASVDLPAPGDARLERDLLRTLSTATAVILHTPEDHRALKASAWLRPETTVHVTAAAGIDLSQTPKSPLPALDNGFTFLLSQPILSLNAVTSFLAAAQLTKAKSGLARFQIAGDLPLDADRAAVAEAIKASPVPVQHAPASEIAPMTKAAHVMVHGAATAGLTSGLLTALAIGRPIIAADVPGSRDTVDEVVNGCLFPPGDAAALADAMQSLLRRSDLLVAMGHASRLKAERRFDTREVMRVMLQALGLDDSRAAAA
jgi:glycosyltransferase involved in cell wall biosynthesis